MSGQDSARSAAAPIGKACSRCGAAFACGAEADGGCWCQEVPPLPVRSADGLRQAYADCLCPACLANLQGPPVS